MVFRKGIRLGPFEFDTRWDTKIFNMGDIVKWAMVYIKGEEFHNMDLENVSKAPRAETKRTS